MITKNALFPDFFSNSEVKFEQNQEYFVFQIANIQFAIENAYVIDYLQEDAIIPFVISTANVFGFCTYHHQNIPLIDLSEILDFEPLETASKKVLIIDYYNSLFGIVINKIVNIHDANVINAELKIPNQKIFDAMPMQFISDFRNVNEHEIILLNLAALTIVLNFQNPLWDI
jgi:chemotaxis signal transduction protein